MAAVHPLVASFELNHEVHAAMNRADVSGATAVELVAICSAQANGPRIWDGNLPVLPVDLVTGVLVDGFGMDEMRHHRQKAMKVTVPRADGSGADDHFYLLGVHGLYFRSDKAWKVYVREYSLAPYVRRLDNEGATAYMMRRSRINRLRGIRATFNHYLAANGRNGITCDTLEARGIVATVAN